MYRAQNQGLIALDDSRDEGNGLQMERLIGWKRSTAPASADVLAAAAAANPMFETARRGRNNFMLGSGNGLVLAWLRRCYGID